jgi:hypothetical protein
MLLAAVLTAVSLTRAAMASASASRTASSGSRLLLLLLLLMALPPLFTVRGLVSLDGSFTAAVAVAVAAGDGAAASLPGWEYPLMGLPLLPPLLLLLLRLRSPPS